MYKLCTKYSGRLDNSSYQAISYVLPECNVNSDVVNKTALKIEITYITVFSETNSNFKIKISCNN